MLGLAGLLTVPRNSKRSHRRGRGSADWSSLRGNSRACHFWNFKFPHRTNPAPVTFLECTIRFSKGADPDSDPTGIWLPRIIQPAIKQTVRSLRPTTHVSTIYLGFHHNDAISSEQDLKNDLISEDESEQHRHNPFLLFPIFKKAHTQGEGDKCASASAGREKRKSAVYLHGAWR